MGVPGLDKRFAGGMRRYVFLMGLLLSQFSFIGSEACGPWSYLSCPGTGQDLLGLATSEPGRMLT